MIQLSCYLGCYKELIILSPPLKNNTEKHFNFKKIALVSLFFTLHALTACSSSVNYPAKNANPVDDKTCGDCHGTSTNFAPPKDTAGNTATSFTGVGAHQSHLVEGPYRVALQCNDCHLVPTEVSAVGHIDTSLPAEVTFGELAKIKGSTPVWTGTTCTGVYCHGVALSGGSNNAPNWTTVDGTQAACGTCHGLPPAAPHPVATATNCYTCHEDVVDSNNKIIDKTLHINGVVDVSNDASTCYSCHGSGATNNAPPKDTSGNTATTFVGVGAHQKHMTTTISSNVSCVECHIVPSQITDPGHNDTALPAEIVFGSLAKTGGVSPVWSGTTCANTYCHGKFTGGLNKTMTWTLVNGLQAKCGTCHKLPPSTGDHTGEDHGGFSCKHCHGTGYSSSTVRISAHINGMKDVGGSGSDITSWNSSTKRCANTCHDPEYW